MTCDRLAMYVQKRRHELHVNMADLERAAGLGESWIGKLERGQLRGLPKVATLEKLAAGFASIGRANREIGPLDAAEELRLLMVAAGYTPSYQAGNAREAGAVYHVEPDGRPLAALGPLRELPALIYPLRVPGIFDVLNETGRQTWPAELAADASAVLTVPEGIAGADLAVAGFQAGDVLFLAEPARGLADGRRVLARVAGRIFLATYRENQIGRYVEPGAGGAPLAVDGEAHPERAEVGAVVIGMWRAL